MRTPCYSPIGAALLGATLALAGRPASAQSECQPEGDWTLHGLGGGGHVSCVAFDTTDPSGDHWYVGTDVAGVFRTCDGGATWRGSTRGMLDTYVQALVVHPDDGEVLFAATQDGITRSDDGGQTWTTDLEVRIGPPPGAGQPDQRERASFSALAFDAFDPDVLWAGVGVFRFEKGEPGKDDLYEVPHVYRRTEVAGQPVWEAIDDPAAGPWPQAVGVHSIVASHDFDPSHPGAEVVLVSSTGGVHYTFWNGVGWSFAPLTGNLPHGDCRDLEVLRDPGTGNATRLFVVLNTRTDGVDGASVYDHSQGYGGGVWHADHLGAPWQATSFADGSDGFHLEAKDESGQPAPCPVEAKAKNMRHLALDAVSGDLYVGLNERSTRTEGVWRASTSAPSWSWERLSVTQSYTRCQDGVPRYANIDFDFFPTVGGVEDVAVNPVTGDVLMTTNMGAYLCPGGDCDPTQPNGGRWEPIHTAITPGTPEVFSTTGLALTQVQQVQVVAETPQVWLAAHYDHGLLRSDDGGASWRYVGSAYGEPYATYGNARNCHGLYRNPEHPDEWLGIFGWWLDPTGQWGGRKLELWRTTGGVPDDASVWEPLLQGPAAPPYMRARDVLFLDGEHVIVATEGGLSRGTRDPSGNWTFQPDDVGIPVGTSRYAYDLEAAPGTALNRRTLVALSSGGGLDGGVLYRDTWGGAWSLAQHLSDPVDGLRSVHKLLWSEVDPNVVVAGRGSVGSAASGGAVLRSVDGGVRWNTPGHPAVQDFGQAPEDFHVSELTARVLPLASGGSFERLYAGLAAREYDLLDADWMPTTFGGVFHSDDGGLTWVDRSAGLDHGLSWDLGRDATDPYRIFYTTKSNGFRSLSDVRLRSLAPSEVKGGGRRTTAITVAYYCPWKLTTLRNQVSGGQLFVERAFLEFPLAGVPSGATVERVEVEVAVHDGAASPGKQVELKRMAQPIGAYGCTSPGNNLFSSITSTGVYATTDGWYGDDITVRVDLGPTAAQDVQAALAGSGLFSLGLRLVDEGDWNPFESIELENVIGPHRLHVHYSE